MELRYAGWGITLCGGQSQGWKEQGDRDIGNSAAHPVPALKSQELTISALEPALPTCHKYTFVKVKNTLCLKFCSFYLYICYICYVRICIPALGSALGLGLGKLVLLKQQLI